MRHIVMDTDTGTSYLESRDHKRYTFEEVAAAEARAEAGDADAAALLESLDFPTTGGIDLRALMHDCPECRAALARGEQPIVMSGEELEAEMARMRRRRARKPVMRWRTQKRRR
jgi:hypothetical protein